MAYVWPPVYDSPESLRGRLQRGLGSAAREILAGDPSAHAALILECIEIDHRLDQQIDRRDDYLAVKDHESSPVVITVFPHL